MRFVFGEHEVDLRRHELRQSGRPVHVEPQVFDLLVHLIRHHDRIVSKDELFETIWNGRIVSEAALSSRVNAARKAVGDDGDRQSVIKTIHRRGFRFIGPVVEAPDREPVTQSKPESVPVTSVVAAAESAPLRPAEAASRKPSMVVLPFRNLSREPDMEYFTYGLTDDVIRLLARNRWLDVLSRHSGAAFKDRDLDAREIGVALSVRYLVAGSVLRRSEQLRITADLVSAETGRHLWSESYDLALTAVIEVQEAMAQQIAAVIEPELAYLERETAMRKPPANIGAWDCYQRGFFHLWGFTTPGIAEAEVMFRRAVELDPGFARAYGALAYVKVQLAALGDLAGRPAAVRAALEYARTAVALDDRDCMNQCVLGRALALSGNLNEAIPILEQSIALNPSFAQAYFALAQALVLVGREREGITQLERATRLSPRDPHLWTFYAVRAAALISLGELEQAAEFARRAVRHPAATYWAHVTLVVTLGLLGRTDEAQAARAELLSRIPDYSVARARADFVGLFSASERFMERYTEGLRRAGIPEHPLTS
jgi:TolB-like protein